MFKKILFKLHDIYIAPLIVEGLIIYFIVSDNVDLNISSNFTIRIPDWLLYSLAILTFIWLVIALWNKYVERCNELHNPYFWNPPRSLERAGDFDHYGVNWDVKRTRGLSEIDRDAEKRIFIEIDPYCPQCGTQLQETKTLIGYYKWECPAGDFSKRSKYGFLKKAEETQSLIRGQIRNGIIANSNY